MRIYIVCGRRVVGQCLETVGDYDRVWVPEGNGGAVWMIPVACRCQ